jgi:multidrug efflux pump subunit AcrB
MKLTRHYSSKDAGGGQPGQPQADQADEPLAISLEAGTGEAPVEMEDAINQKLNIGGILTRMFVDNKTTLLIMIAALIFGVLALVVTPREENPQISVPAVNVIVPFPGAGPQEVENLICKPLERLIWNIKGVEHIYSTAMPDAGIVTVQFMVGQDQNTSVYKVFETVYANLDSAPAGSLSPMIKPVDINDVPIIGFTLFSDRASTFDLRQTGEALVNELREIHGTGACSIVGGDEREITVAIDPVKSAAYAIDPMLIAQSLGGENFRLPAGKLETGSERILVRSGQYLRNAEDVGSVVVATHKLPDGSGGEPVYLRDIAAISDGPAEQTNLSRVSFGPSASEAFEGEVHGGPDALAGRSYNAVTVAIAKQKGTNSVSIAKQVLAKMEQVAPLYLTDDTQWVVTRNDGENANEAVNELLFHLSMAIIIVIALLMFFLGWRDAAVVTVAIPITMLVTLGIGLLFGQTINRITLFALILSLGLLVDDAIVVVENIHRHLHMRPKGASLIRTAILAVNEIANPTIYATLVVVVSMVPMAFVTGMMGPYMGPIPFNVPVAMMISLLVAFKISPYLSIRWLKVPPFGEGDHGKQPEEKETYEGHPAAIGEGEACPIERSAGENEHIAGASPKLVAFFTRLMTPLMEDSRRRNLLFGWLALALVICFTFPMLTWVKFRMLPKANGKTFLVTVDMPASSSLSNTDKLAHELEDVLLREPHVRQVITTVGTGSVIDFNGLLRGTSFRSNPNQADLRVNLTHKHARKEKSEEIVRRLRPVLHKLGEPYGAVIKLVEDPPGPPVQATMLAEIYGPYGQMQRDLVTKLRGWFAETPNVTDIDDSVSTVPAELRIRVDSEKAIRAGLQPADVAMSLRAALAGYPVTQLHDPSEQTQVDVVLRFPVQYRSSVDDLRHIVLPSPQGPVPLLELVKMEQAEAFRPIHRKDLRPVSYVYGEMAQGSSVYANIALLMREKKDPLPPGYSLAWSGEWDLTLKVFRDLGIAMGVAILLIYLLLVGRFKSFSVPLVLMGPVPLTMLGVLPGFAIVGLFDVYFSATGMIGVIALAGIVVRNSLILIEFIQDAVAEGMPLKDAVIFAGAIRTRPIILTAIAAMAGMLMMVTDPVWSGLSWALLFGITASTPLSLLIIPLLYYAAVKSKEHKQAAA